MRSYSFWTKCILTLRSQLHMPRFSSPISHRFLIILAHKLISDFNLGNQLVAWIVDYLSCRPQSVFVNGKFSDMRLTHTGLPQGCISPLLYILYTDSCRSAHADRFLVKFADDSALLSLLFGSQQDHGPALRDFVNWCDDSYLKFNVCKTK